MEIRLLSTVPELRAYEEWLAHHPDASLWQSLAWRSFQQVLGRETRLYAGYDHEGVLLASALVIIDRTAGGFSTWDIPRGPLEQGRTIDTHDVLEGLLDRIIADARKSRCMALFLSPSLPLPLPADRYPLSVSPRHEQPPATRIVDLSLSEEDILAQMHSKGRYNIKVAQKNGVRVEESADGEAFARLARDTAARDGFKALPGRHYQAFLQHLPGSFLLLAYGPESASTPIAGLIGARWKECGIYYYGASSYAHRSLMAPYALQWEAMRRCKAQDCLRYDLLGIAPPDAGADHAWQGISGFKEKFGGRVVVYPPEQQLILKPVTLALLSMKRRFLG